MVSVPLALAGPNSLPPVLFDAESLGVAAAVAAAVTLVVGRSLGQVVPDRTARVTARVQTSPAGSFAYGAVVALGASLAAVLLFFTFVGFPAAIVLGLALVLAVAVGGALAYLALAQAIAPPAAGDQGPLVIGAATAGAVTLVPVVGGLTTLAFCVAGFGAMFVALYDT